MNPTIKIDLAAALAPGRRVLVELGCGPSKAPGHIGIDRLDLPGVDIVADLEKGLSFLPDASVDEIHSDSFLEHVTNFEDLMREIVRTLKPGGICRIFVPHFSNPFYYSDYTHIRFFGLYTFRYFCSEAEQREMVRKVPSFYSEIRIKLLSQRLTFYSSFRGVRFLKKLFQRAVNLSRWTQEFYEENLCYLIPCYGMDIRFTPDRDAAATAKRP